MKKHIEFYLKSTGLDKWLYQNKAFPTGNYVEGCFLENAIYECKRGYAFVYESYVNSNSLRYLIKFAPYEEGHTHFFTYDYLWKEFHALENAANEHEIDAW